MTAPGGGATRLLKRLPLRGLLAKIPRSRRWRVTHLGHAVLSTAVLLREEHAQQARQQDAQIAVAIVAERLIEWDGFVPSPFSHGRRPVRQPRLRLRPHAALA